MGGLMSSISSVLGNSAASLGSSLSSAAETVGNSVTSAIQPITDLSKPLTNTVGKSLSSNASVGNTISAVADATGNSAINNLKGISSETGINSIDAGMNNFQNQYNNSVPDINQMNTEQANRTILDDAYSKIKDISDSTGISQFGSDLWKGLTTKESVLTTDQNGKTDWSRTLTKGAGRLAQQRIMSKVKDRIGNKNDYFDDSEMINRAKQFHENNKA